MMEGEMSAQYEFPDTGRARATLQFWGAAAYFAVSVTVHDAAAGLLPRRQKRIRAAGSDEGR